MVFCLFLPSAAGMFFKKCLRSIFSRYDHQHDIYLIYYLAQVGVEFCNILTAPLPWWRRIELVNYCDSVKGVTFHLCSRIYLFSAHAIRLCSRWCLQRNRWIWLYSGCEQLQQGDHRRWSCSTFPNVLVVLFESVTGVAGGVDRREKINSTDDVLLPK